MNDASARRSARSVFVLIAAIVLPAALAIAMPAAASPRPVTADHAVGGRVSVAAVSVRSSAALPLAVPGGHVLEVLPYVDAEIVRAPRAALARLARNPAVIGIAGNTTGSVAGFGWGGHAQPAAPGFYASQAVGGFAGSPNAGAGVTVALLDTGIDDTPALNRASGRLVDGIDLSSITSGQPPVTSGSFTDGYGHGTFLASLIAGGPTPGSNGQAIGIAPAATVVDVKVAGDDGTTSLWQMLAGLNWVAAHADSINVVNLSFAMTRASYPAYGADPLTAAVEDVRAAGVEVVAAVGNTPGQVGDPGMDPQALTVGAYDSSDDQIASFSGSGDVDGVLKPDVVAPGVDLLGEMDPTTEIAHNFPDAYQPNGLFRGSGTSESTAIVSGVAAIILALHPDLTPIQLKAAIRVAAQPSSDPRAGAGLVSFDNMGGWGSYLRGLTGRSAKFGGCGWRQADLTGEGCFDETRWWQNAWLGGTWQPSFDQEWSASSWSASSWSASSWSDASWSASSWSASSWSDAYWGDGP